MMMFTPVFSTNIEGQPLEHDNELIAKNAIINRHRMDWGIESQDDDIKEAIKHSNDTSGLSPNQKNIIDEAKQTSVWNKDIGNYYSEWRHMEPIIYEDNRTTWNENDERVRNVTNGTAVNTHNTSTYSDVQINESLIIRTINTTMYFEQINDVNASGYYWTYTEGWWLVETKYLVEEWYFYDVTNDSISFYYSLMDMSTGNPNWEWYSLSGWGSPRTWNYQETINWVSELITYEEIIIPLDTNTTIQIADEIKVDTLTEITGIVSDELGNIVGNILINVNINGQNFPTQVDKFGKWLVEYLPKSSGDFNINVTWGGNKYYTGFTNTLNFHVLDIPTSFDENTEEYKISKISKYQSENNTKVSSNIDVKSAEKNIPKTTATMKNTGTPIVVILLIILTSLGITINRRL